MRGASMAGQEFKEALQAELHRRVGVLSAEGDAAFGHFDERDWAVVVVLFLAVPILLIWWLA